MSFFPENEFIIIVHGPEPFDHSILSQIISPDKDSVMVVTAGVMGNLTDMIMGGQ
ncbi:hypothetical protein [Methanoplanus endosymbiosus]|uniref:Uncharacterized protein n=1 Tax=Methanoplanus endosymbiosus TaxID=33865 RepID=A0A9E7PQF4_9EURY|nr:hypothetical protein [Methanoplanus endosymbiosus]UUX91627.1 hypothetical protein L6E24_09615 [Methanoplanus endosymbiosus]